MLDEQVLTLTTLFYKEDYAFSKKFPKKLNVYIADNIVWTPSNICMFLNELSLFNTTKHSFIRRGDAKNQKLVFHFNIPQNPNVFVFIKISDHITVQMSTEDIKLHWTSQLKFFKSNFGSENKIKKKSTVQAHIRFTYCSHNLSKSSIYFIKNSSLIYFSKYNFSKILHYFSKRILINKMPFGSDFETIQNYVDFFSTNMHNVYHSFDDLKSIGVKRFLLLKLRKKKNI